MLRINLQRVKMKPSVLYFDQNKKNRKSTQRMLSSLRIPSVIPESISELEERVSLKKDRVLVLDIEEHKKLIESKMDLSSHQVILLSREKLEFIKPYLDSMDQFNNFIAKKEEDYFDKKELLITIKKILDKDLFGPEKYMGWAATSMVYHIRSSSERDTFVDLAVNYCQQMKLRSPMIEAVRTLCEEMLMNAIYDAPRDIHGNELYNHLPRSQHVILRPEEAARFQICSDGEKLAVSVTDPFGSLKKDTVLNYLDKCLADEHKLGPQEKGGAGLGIFFCYKSVSNLVINVDPGYRTEFIGIINLQESVRQLKSGTRSFHFFSTTPKIGLKANKTDSTNVA